MMKVNFSFKSGDQRPAGLPSYGARGSGRNHRSRANAPKARAASLRRLGCATIGAPEGIMLLSRGPLVSRDRFTIGMETCLRWKGPAESRFPSLCRSSLQTAFERCQNSVHRNIHAFDPGGAFSSVTEATR
jgi:hypothetical protein